MVTNDTSDYAQQQQQGADIFTRFMLIGLPLWYNTCQLENQCFGCMFTEHHIQ